MQSSSSGQNQLPVIGLTIEPGNWPDHDRVIELTSRAIEAVAAEAELMWPSGAELSLLLTSDEAMRKINRQWRDKDAPTNVLSFPGSDVTVGESAGLVIGDLVFADETVHREAVEQNKDFEQHFLHLVVHGFLHLFGYDHLEEREAEEMEALERRALAALGISDPYA